MLVILGFLIFFPLLIGSIVAGTSESPWLRYFMCILAISPLPLLNLMLTIVDKRWDFFFDKDFYFFWGILILLHIIIRFVARRLLKCQTK